MKSAKMLVSWQFEVECPYCGADIDLNDQKDDDCLTNPIFNNKWDDIVGMKGHCPDCSEDFLISKVEC